MGSESGVTLGESEPGVDESAGSVHEARFPVRSRTQPTRSSGDAVSFRCFTLRESDVSVATSDISMSSGSIPVPESVDASASRRSSRSNSAFHEATSRVRDSSSVVSRPSSAISSPSSAVSRASSAFLHRWSDVPQPKREFPPPPRDVSLSSRCAVAPASVTAAAPDRRARLSSSFLLPPFVSARARGGSRGAFAPPDRSTLMT